MRQRLRKVLKWLGLTVLGLVVAALLVAVWSVRRRWPQTEGEIAAAGLAAPVRVVRDTWGVPQIYAGNEHDLFFAQGYVHAQDRLWQMDFDRRVSGGTLAALLGGGLVETDRYIRTMGIRRAAARDWPLLAPATRDLLTAYADGVNAYVRTHRDRLPVEFTLLGVQPEPWTPLDTLAWGKMMAFSLGQNHVMELMRARLAARLGEATALAMLPPSPGAPLIVSPQAGGYGAVRAAAAGLAGETGDPALRAAGMARGANDLGLRSTNGPAPRSAGDPVLAALLGPPSSALGSNAWVVHGSRTASGRPLLVNDTHLGLSMPSPWYENGLHGGRFEVAGFSFPGVPLVLIGHNGHIAWGISNMCGDVQDVYVETRNRQGQFLTGAGWREPQVLREEIPVRGGKPVALAVTVTRHGPVINDVETLGGPQPVALRWTGHDGGRLLDSLAAVDLAADWPAFRQALSVWPAPALNFVYADDAGNIGYQAAGKIPLRSPRHPGTLPVAGATDDYEWRGMIPWEGMPRLFNPAAGYIVTANNRVVGDGYPYRIAEDYADPYRAQRIADLLAATPRVAVADVERIQADTYSLPAAALRPYLLAVQPANELQRRALAQVRAWDLRFRPESAGATIYYAWFRTLLEDIVADEVGDDLMRDFRGFVTGQTPLFIRLMAQPNHPWFDDRRTPRVETRDDIVRRALGESLDRLRQRLGDDPAAWQWGKLHTAFLAHPPFGQSGIAPLERLFNGEAVALPGDGMSVDANGANPNPRRLYRSGFGVTQRMIVDLGDLSRSLAINSTGQSGHLFHPHREDQIRPWSRGEYHPMPWSPQAVAAGARDRLLLEPRPVPAARRAARGGS